MNHTEHPFYGPFFCSMGITYAMVLTAAGSAYGTAKAGKTIAAIAVSRPDLIMKSIISVIMAGIITIYGLILAVVLSGKFYPSTDGYSLDQGFAHLASGLTCGLCGLGAGWAIGIISEAGVYGTARQPRLFIGLILMLIFAEVLGLYGMIIALILSSV